MRNHSVGKFLCGLWAVLFCVHSWATALENPVKFLDSTVVKLQSELYRQHATLAQSPQKLYQVVSTIILPIVDVPRMAGMTLGPKWRAATPAQRKAFVQAFGLLVTRTYSKALLSVATYKIEIYPLRGDGWKTQKYIAVNGSVRPDSGGSPSRVTYYLLREGNSWKIYDFAVEGVSFVQNFHSQFQGFSSMAKLLEKLQHVNDAHG